MSDERLKYLLFAAMVLAVLVAIVLYIDYYSLFHQNIGLLEYMNESCFCTGMYLEGIG